MKVRMKVKTMMFNKARRIRAIEGALVAQSDRICNSDQRIDRIQERIEAGHKATGELYVLLERKIEDQGQVIELLLAELGLELKQVPARPERIIPAQPATRRLTKVKAT